MTRVFLSLATVVVSVSLIGCGPSRPDPRDNPNFNEAAMTDPTAVKMDGLKAPQKR